MILKNILALLTAFFSFIASLFSFCSEPIKNYSFSISTESLDRVIGNMASNVNVWDMGEMFYDAEKNGDNDVFEFVEYVQLMECSGGNAARDLFVDPLDFDTLDDYDFTRLVKNCEGILRLGAKPHLKLGNVPLKYSSNASIGVFEVNVYPPDDYDVYYDYIAALATALVENFGREEVLTWRFGVLTEFENDDWFVSLSGSEEDTAVAYCKLYDCTVSALENVIGDVYIGAHAMVYPRGTFDIEDFVKHCAVEKNYKTGKTGTRLCYLSASFYDGRPGEAREPLENNIAKLRSCAEKYGFYDISYGVDEGRILSGNVKGNSSDALMSRSVGYTWQAAYDARLYAKLIENDVEYFSYWSHLSEGLLNGFPTVSYHVSRNISKFRNSKLAKTQMTRKGLIMNAEVNAVSAFDEENNTLHVMAYNYKNDLEYKKTAHLSFDISVPQFADGEATLTVYVIDDDCNYFDEWCHDRETNGITADCYAWSPDDATVSGINEKAANVYKDNYARYVECAKLVPVTQTVEIENSMIHLEKDLAPNTVLFFELTR